MFLLSFNFLKKKHVNTSRRWATAGSCFRQDLTPSSSLGMSKHRGWPAHRSYTCVGVQEDMFLLALPRCTLWKYSTQSSSAGKPWYVSSGPEAPWGLDLLPFYLLSFLLWLLSCHPWNLLCRPWLRLWRSIWLMPSRGACVCDLFSRCRTLSWMSFVLFWQLLLAWRLRLCCALGS